MVRLLHVSKAALASQSPRWSKHVKIDADLEQEPLSCSLADDFPAIIGLLLPSHLGVKYSIRHLVLVQVRRRGVTELQALRVG